MTKRKPGGREAARAPVRPAREAARSKKTIDVDPRWLEEVKAPMPEAKAGEPNAPVAGAGAPVRRMTMEVDPVWLEETRGEAAAGLAPPAPGARARKVSPPPLPPIAAAAKEAPTSAKRKTPPPLPREEPDGGDAKTKPIARRSTRPPRR